MDTIDNAGIERVALHRLFGAAPLLILIMLMLAMMRPDPSFKPRSHANRTVTDATGKTVNIDLFYRGSAFLAPVLADYLFATCRSDTVLTNPSPWLLAGHLLGRIYPDMPAKPSLPRGGGRGGMVESLLRLHPGAVFAWYFQVPALQRIGLPTVAVGMPGGEESPLARARPYAEALGQYGRAETIAAHYQSAMAETVRERAAQPPSPNPRVLAIGFFSGGRIVAWGKGNPYVRLMALAGADSATAASNPAILDTEHVLALDPDAVILRPGGELLASPTPASFMRQSRWRSLDAVKARRVYQMPEGGSVYFGGIVEDPLLVRWVAELLHPDLRPRLRAMMREAYARELGITLSEFELDAMLGVPVNSQSAGYGRFADEGKRE